MTAVVGECFAIRARTQEDIDMGVPDGFGVLLLQVPVACDMPIGHILFKECIIQPRASLEAEK